MESAERQFADHLIAADIDLVATNHVRVLVVAQPGDEEGLVEAAHYTVPVARRQVNASDCAARLFGDISELAVRSQQQADSVSQTCGDGDEVVHRVWIAEIDAENAAQRGELHYLRNVADHCCPTVNE